MNFNVAVIPGDGIGPEIVAEAKKCWTQSEISSDTVFITRKWTWAVSLLINLVFHLLMRL